MTKIKDALFWMTHTKYGWLIISLIWSFACITIYSNSDSGSNLPLWIAVPPLLYMVGLTVTAIVYAFIINPIKDRKK